MTNNRLRKPKKPNRMLKFSYCPRCGQKGLYHIHQQYSRCRYCGLYIMSLPGQDF